MFLAAKSGADEDDFASGSYLHGYKHGLHVQCRSDVPIFMTRTPRLVTFSARSWTEGE